MEKKPPLSTVRVAGYLATGTLVLAAVATAASNADTLLTLWQKYFGRASLSPLEDARNAPRDLIYSSDPVSLELVQVAHDSESREQVYDLYMRNNTDRDLLLSEVRYGPGVAYLSMETHGLSGTTEPTAEYSITQREGSGSIALSPPFSLRAGALGALRLRMPLQNPMQTSAFQIIAADGTEVAAVNTMLHD
jgi:hypothetical protein